MNCPDHTYLGVLHFGPGNLVVFLGVGAAMISDTNRYMWACGKTHLPVSWTVCMGWWICIGCFCRKGTKYEQVKKCQVSVSHVNIVSWISRIWKVEDIWKFSAGTLGPRVRALVRNESSVPSTPGAGIPHGAVGGPSNFLVRTAYHVSSLAFTRTAPDKGRKVVQLIGVRSYMLHDWDI